MKKTTKRPRVSAPPERWEYSCPNCGDRRVFTALQVVIPPCPVCPVRDMFAAAVLTRLAVHVLEGQTQVNETVARRAFELADAMMRARERGRVP